MAKKKKKEASQSGLFTGKKAVISGERDDVPGATLRKCVEAAGGEIVLELTACAV